MPVRGFRNSQKCVDNGNLNLTVMRQMISTTTTLGTEVLSIANAQGFGSSEEDLTRHKLFRQTEKKSLKITRIPVSIDDAFVVSSLPLGTFHPGSLAKSAGISSKLVHLASSSWREDALDKIRNIVDHIPAKANRNPFSCNL